MQIADEIRQEMGVDHPLRHVLLVHSPDQAGQLQLGIHLVDHCLQGLVGAVLGAGGDILCVMAEAKSGVLRITAQPLGDQIEFGLQLLGAGILQAGLIELQRIDRG